VTNLLYVGIAVAISTLAILVLWYRNRKPRSLESGIEEFQRELRALAPDRGRPTGAGGFGGSSTEQKDRRTAG
jgi:hypothetical protein